MRTSAVIPLGLLLIAQLALARFGQSPLTDVLAGSERVVAATITSARVVPYPSGRDGGSCGYIYEARVTETFKGSHSASIRFASDEPMTPDSVHLLFLRNDDKDFPSDQSVRLVDPKTNEEFDPREGCTRVLTRLKSNWLHTAEMMPDGQVRLSYWITPPPELHAVSKPMDPLRAQDGLQISFVQWSVLRGWLMERVK